MNRFNALLALLLLLAGCGGTGTGNPTSGDAANVPTAAPSTAAAAILSHACSKLDACYPSLSVDACKTGVLASSVIDTQLGLASGFGTYQKIIDSETAGTIRASAAAVSTCESDIDALACSSTAVQSAYSASAPSDFSNVEKLIPTGATSCPAVYKP